MSVNAMYVHLCVYLVKRIILKLFSCKSLCACTGIDRCIYIFILLLELGK